MPELVQTSIANNIATMTLNRPEARNALSPELIEAMNMAIEGVQREAAPGSGKVRIMILAGAGTVFCAGMDLKGVLRDPVKMAHMLRGLFAVHAQGAPSPHPHHRTRARRGGRRRVRLMVVTDFAFTHPESKVGYPEVDLGVCPAVVAPWLVKKIGAGRARAMLLAGGTMSASRGSTPDWHRTWLRRINWNRRRSIWRANLSRRSAGVGRHQALAQRTGWLDGGCVFDKAAELSAQVIAGEEAQTRLRTIHDA